ncbi:hypothetical protein [Niallia sp. 03133]|uniref:hypothetical protein n=1 Tax=Niallia sp. 03133 TaxID=3458060 RepID=UPI004043EA19
MVEVKLVKIDGKSIHLFNSAIYIFASSTGYTLELDIIVSEVVVNKYRQEENLILEIELQDGRLINTFMHLKSLSGGLPQLNLFCELNDMEEYQDFLLVNENDSLFPNIEEGITLEEIREHEMPNEKVTLKLNLPIDQAEWIKKKKNKELAEIIKEAIYGYWKNNENR